MPEPVSIVAMLQSWLAKKSAETAWQRIYPYLRPDRLKKEIEAALKSDPAVIQPPPTLYKARLTAEIANELLKVAVTKDADSLADYLIEEQLVSLPSYPDEKPVSYDAVWACIAHTIINAVSNAVVKDEQLSQQLLLIAEELGHLERQQILTEVEMIRDLSIEQGNQLQRVEDSVSRSHESTHAAVLTDAATVRTVNLLTEQNEQLEGQLRGQLDEKTERLWDFVLKEIQTHNFSGALIRGEELTKWLDAKSAQLSNAVRGRGYLLLAQVALIDSSMWGKTREGFAKSQELFEKARDEFGEDISDENKLRLSNFEAKLLCIDNKDQEALALLKGATDPHSVTTKLLIFIDNDESEKGVDLIRDMPFDAKWCDHAAFVFARTGDDDRTRAALTWAGKHGDELLEHRCRVAIAKATLMRLSDTHGDSVLSSLSINDDASQAAEEVLKCLLPIVEECRVRNKVKSGLEADAIGFACRLSRLIGQFDEARSNAELLQKFQPVHLEYANAVIRGDVEFDADVAGRLRDNYANYYPAQELALSIDIQAGLGPGQILDQVEKLARDANALGDREKLARMIIQTSSMSGQGIYDRAREIIEELIGDEHFLFLLFEAHHFYQIGNFEKFEQTLGKLEGEKDYLLDQFRAQLLIRQEKYANAAEKLLSVGRHMSEPDLLVDAARLALDAKPTRLDLAVAALEAALVLRPKNLITNRMLAFVYIQLQGFASAADCFARMKEIEPDELTHALNHAQCCVLANQPDAASDIYDELCRRSDAPVEAHLGRANLISNLGAPFNAFASLHKIRDQNWENPAFVANYLNLAYAANQDRLANEGFQQLWNLRESGKAPFQVLQPKSMEDLIQINKDAQERRKFLFEQTLVGKLPWIFVESFLGNVPYWAWRIRTQPVSWFFDDAGNRVSFSIYSTNSYAVLQDEDRKSLKRVKCPGQGSSVVTDLSALITLHRLDLLDQAIEYFGQVQIPPSYLTGVLQQSGRLQPHQQSQKANLESIKMAIETQKMHVVEEVDGLDVIDEYRDDNEAASYRIQDLLSSLRSAGRISQTQMEEALCVANKPAMASELRGELDFSNHIAVSLTTLETIVGEGLLETLCDAFDRVSISKREHERMIQELRVFDLTAQTQLWHEDLWKRLSEDDRVHTDKMVMWLRNGGNDPKYDESAESESDGVSAIDAALLAQQENFPLLVDDRVCQNIALQANPHDETAAFGSDCLLMGMLDAGIIDRSQAARAYLQLVEWRYRFLICPVPILKTIATEFSDHDLRKVALYVHDCMRDPGLFGGPEPTEPPLPIAFRYYQDWLEVIAKFVTELWLDESVSQERATELTTWAMMELVPSVPKVLGERIGRVANYSPFTLLMHAVYQLCEMEDYSKANLALRVMAGGLGLDDKEFIRVAEDIIDCHV